MRTQNIIVELVGGLGNQLFQYACAQTLLAKLRSASAAEQVAYTLWLDGTSVLRDVKRTLSLHSMLKEHAAISKNHVIHSRKTLFSLLGERVHASLNFFEKVIHRVRPYVAPSEARNYTFLFEDALLAKCAQEDASIFAEMVDVIHACDTPVFIRGFWQYSTMVVNLLANAQRDFLCLPQPAAAFESTHNYIRAYDDSVSVHVRRTDYLDAQEEYPPCDIDYYKHAIHCLKRRFLSKQGNKTMSVFIFSDDPAWCKDVLMPVLKKEDDRISYKLISNINSEGFCDVEELVLMSRCAHHVLANSSFSWWGSGMLAKVFLPDEINRHEGIVIAPKRWNTNVHRTRRIHINDWVLL